MSKKSQVYKYQPISVGKLIPLSIQHVFAMFGATILVPLLTGLNPATALLTSGLGTLLFQFITRGQVPAYLGSSFAFIAPIQAASSQYGVGAALGGCVVAGLVYVLISIIIKALGIEFLSRILPPIVVGPVIITIGLGLADVAKQMASQHILTALVTLGVTIAVSLFAKGFFKLLPILIGMLAGYVFALTQNLVDLTPVIEASWFALPQITTPQFTLPAIALIAPVAVVTMVEHLGDILAISRTVGNDFTVQPGVHRTLLGDGLATALAGFLGGPPNTTYGENTGVLAITKVYNPVVIRGAALVAVILSFIQKFGAWIGTVPDAVKGGISILLFGMIASIGIRTLVEKQIDFSDSRNLVIASTILVIGISKIELAIGPFNLAGMGLAAIIGIILNLILPQTRKDKKATAYEDKVVKGYKTKLD
jgi:uracil permease